eukprot:TRINITY_DN1510_c0_g1_i1.p2 TRINITY_DN1510_c0_g1~~TRINITY_DN1510_c0_g1_i1.p2  ORF type:complete len:411 (-),score=75.90 TRINITY_DN1510_c0_g1_i1:1441-2673(-)
MSLQSVPESLPFIDLPPLVLIHVLGNLTETEMIKASETCRDIYSLCQHNAVWKRIAKKKWNIKPSNGIIRPTKWKHYFSQKTAVTKEGAFKWQALNPTGDVLSKRYQHTGAVVGDDIWYVGGQELPEKRFDDIHVLRTATNEMVKINTVSGNPPCFARHSCVSVGSMLYTFGGFDGVSKHFYLSTFDTKKFIWNHVKNTPDTPISRTNHSAVAVGDKMYLFGGMYKLNAAGGDKLVFLNDMQILDTSTMTWRKVQQKGTVPSVRCGHRMIAFGKLLVLFGGGCGEQWDVKYSDVHVFDTETETWAKPAVVGQAPVCTFTITFSAGVFLFVFGGQNLKDNNLTNDLYCLDTVSMVWTKVAAEGQHPGARDMASGNMLNDNMYMFGGYSGAAIDTFFKLEINPEIMSTPPSM